MKNHLSREKSPYLLQHAENPVEWYPWCAEAFERAKREDKPVFLSIGYSTCHWCHVMAHESFENEEIAATLNEQFISIKVDREERPDIDSVYMAVCQAFTGSGGWPTSIFMTPEQKPFFAGTYFPPSSRYGTVGFQEILRAVSEKWNNERPDLLDSAEEIVKHLNTSERKSGGVQPDLMKSAVEWFSRSFDEKHGGFGSAPKFPSPHNLLFLLAYSQHSGDPRPGHMAEKTLTQMRRGGLFDHIGWGFSRYSTDERFLVPHFEKMLYDNALLILAYTAAYTVSKEPLYLDTAEKTAAYVLREMTSPKGAFYSAQDADSEGEEGKFYTFHYEEILGALGDKNGAEFCEYYGMSGPGNFEGKNIPNRLHRGETQEKFSQFLPELYEYRKNRMSLSLDDKILTSWNAWMICAFSLLSQVTGNQDYLSAAQAAQRFLDKELSEGDKLYVSWRDGQHSDSGFLEDYACCAAGLISLYTATLEQEYLERAQALCRRAMEQFEDTESGGYYLSGGENERLIFRQKEAYDGAMPSGNSTIAYCLVRLSQLTGEAVWEQAAQRQLAFLSGEAEQYPAGYSMFLLSLLLYLEPAPIITVAPGPSFRRGELLRDLPVGANVKLLDGPNDQYGLLNEKTTYYVCKGHTCLPPSNTLG